MAISRFDATELSMGGLLGEGFRLKVPIHQRDFRWTEDEIEQFFTDVNDAMSSGQREYFIGLMVFMTGDSRDFIILDGQQRIATIMIILSSIRSWLNRHDFITDANQIQNDYISIRRLGETILEPRLILNENNNIMFNNYVIHEAPLNDVSPTLEGLNRYDPNRLLLEAVIFCRNKINDLVSDVDAREEKARILFNFVNYILENVRIVRFSVPNDSNAFTIFETLNDRGLDLSIIDLVKNHLFGIASLRSTIYLPEVQRRWNQMMSHLTNVPADNFLKAYWTSRYGRIQKAQLFPNFKREVSTWSDVNTISNDMFTASEQYSALASPYDPIWSEINEESRRRIISLDIMGALQVHPVLLSALSRFEVPELERLLHLLEVLIARYQLIGGGRTGRLEIECANLAVEIYSGRIVNSRGALEQIKDIMPSNEDFRNAFQRKQETNGKKIRYILTQLESEARRRQGQEMGEELRAIESLTIEHILPKRPNGNWQLIIDRDPDLQRDCTNILGNICLLSQVNRTLGNRSFSEKCIYYRRSSLHLTNMIAEYNDWTRTQIENRQRHMANLAISAWHYP